MRLNFNEAISKFMRRFVYYISLECNECCNNIENLFQYFNSPLNRFGKLIFIPWKLLHARATVIRTYRKKRERWRQYVRENAKRLQRLYFYEGTMDVHLNKNERKISIDTNIVRFSLVSLSILSRNRIAQIYNPEEIVPIPLHLVSHCTCIKY